MATLRFEDGTGLKLSATAGFVALAVAGMAPPPPPPGSLSITPALTVKYMDASNVLQSTTVVSGSTVITGVAPFSVEFNATGTRSTETDANTAGGARMNIGYFFDFGEGRGGTWSHGISGRSRDTCRGFPLCPHTYETAGTFTARQWCYHPVAGLALITFTVVVTLPEVDVAMESGVIPSWADDTVYGLPAGGEWGDFDTTGFRGLTFMKTGVGADPIVGTVTLDSRNEPNSVITRAGNIRFWNCDVAGITFGNVGFEWATFAGGRVRTISLPNYGYAGDQLIENSRTALQASNVRVPIGLFLQNTGEMNPVPGVNYVMIGEGRSFHFKNVLMRRTDVVSTLTEHNLRGVYKESTFRDVTFTNPTSVSRSYNKVQGWDCTVGVDLTDSGGGIPVANGVPDEWPDSGMVIALATPESPTAAGGRRLGLPSDDVAFVDCFYGSADDGPTEANVGAGAENNDALQPGQGCRYVIHEYCHWYQTNIPYNASYTGQWVGMRQCFFGSGSGSAVGISAGVDHPRRTPDGWEGPYITSGARPDAEAAIA